jgi:hypothetical protein
MLDVILQGCGSMEAGMQFCADNGVSITDVPVVGVVYVVTDAALAVAGGAGAAVVKYLMNNMLELGTLNQIEAVTVPVWGTEDGQIIGTEDGAAMGVE